jgi:RNA polymerase sigma-70 factor (sigma-E family)
MIEPTTVAARATTGARMDDRDADFTAYLEARQGRLLRTAYLLTGDQHQAEDLLQTSMAKLYLAWDKVRDRSSLDSYARRILVNEHNSAWRRPWRRRERPTDFADDGAPVGTPVRHAYDEGVGDAVWQIVQTLPRRARAVVVLRYYEQLTEAETAEVLGISVGTVKSQNARAMASLRERTPATLRPGDREEER